MFHSYDGTVQVSPILSAILKLDRQCLFFDFTVPILALTTVVASTLVGPWPLHHTQPQVQDLIHQVF